jgi:hypothetical protein
MVRQDPIMVHQDRITAPRITDQLITDLLVGIRAMAPTVAMATMAVPYSLAAAGAMADTGVAAVAGVLADTGAITSS